MRRNLLFVFSDQSMRIAPLLRIRNVTANTAASLHGDSRASNFKFQKALLVSKMSRYEFEQHKNPTLTTEELEQVLRARGTDYEALISFHRLQKEYEAKIARSFQHFDKDVKLANRFVSLFSEFTRITIESLCAARYSSLTSFD